VYDFRGAVRSDCPVTRFQEHRKVTPGDLLSNTTAKPREATSQTSGSFIEVLAVATRLGLTSFGGPIAHLGLAALYNPVWTAVIHGAADFGLALLAFGLLMFWKWPPWLVVVLTALGGEALARI
jgi:chromate transport protein ChrA